MLKFTGIFMQQEPDVASPYPIINSVAIGSFTSDTTSHQVVLPGSISAGELILAMIGLDGSGSVSATDFTSKHTTNNSTNARLTVLAKVAVGTEGGTTVDFVTSASEKIGVYIYIISNWGGSIANSISAGTAIIGTINPHDPPSLTTGWGSVPTKWFAVCATSSASTLTGTPASYSYAPGAQSWAGESVGTTSALIVSLWRDVTAASEDPGTFTFSGNALGISNTFAVLGA